TLRLLMDPTFTVRGQSDLYWLSLFFEPFRKQGLTPEQVKGLNSLHKIYDQHPDDLSLAVIAKMTAETLDDTRQMQDKLARANELGLPLSADFIYRADIPLFSQKETVQLLDHDVELPAELD